MTGSPLHRFGGLGTFDGIDEFEDRGDLPATADAVAGAVDEALAGVPPPRREVRRRSRRHRLRPGGHAGATRSLPPTRFSRA